MLTKQEILNHMFSDIYSYRENIEHICLYGFTDELQIEWSAWFNTL